MIAQTYRRYESVKANDDCSSFTVVINDGANWGRAEEIDQIMVRRRKIERFIESVKELPELITEFDESLWAGLVDSMIVYAKDRITFRLTCGMEIEA